MIRSTRNLAMPMLALLGAMSIVVAACGGGSEVEPDGGATVVGEGSTATDGGSQAGGAGATIADPAPVGVADMTVEGTTLTFPTVSTCNVSVDGEFNFNFLAEDGLSDIRAGGFRADEMGWMGAITVYLEDGSGYTAPLQESTSLVVDGKSLVLVGPILFQPRNDGSLPSSRPAGEGTIRATCL